MRATVAAVAGGAAALAAASGLGVAAAESTGGASTPPVRTISVGGVAEVPIPQGANAATANGVYRQGLAAAVADGLGKAELLASKVSGSVGPAQSVVEGGGYITCTDAEGGYTEYEGQQPDFPTSQVGVGVLQAGASAPAVGRPAVGRRVTKIKRRHVAHRAAAASCTLHASVSLAYQIG
jgi:hypothetical protein